jgi:multiple sugar transport system permease protein
MNAAISTNGVKRGKSAKGVLYLQRGVAYFIIALLVIICILPFYSMLVNATHTHAEIATGVNFWFGTALFDNLEWVFTNINIPTLTALRNSLLVSLACATLTVYFSALTAYATHIYHFKGKKFVEVFIIAIMMIPTQVSSLGLVLLSIKWNMLDTFVPIILPAIASPITYFYLKQYFDSILPLEVIEAARADGASEIRIFHQIAMPMVKPAIALQFIFSFVGSWNNFFIPSLLLNAAGDHTLLPLIISLLKNSSPETFNLGGVYCIMTVAIMPLLIVFFIFSRNIIKGLTVGAVKG